MRHTLTVSVMVLAAAALCGCGEKGLPPATETPEVDQAHMEAQMKQAMERNPGRTRRPGAK